MAPGQNIEVGDLPPELKGEPSASAGLTWISALEKELENRLNHGESAIMDTLVADFERTCIIKALAHTGGRRIEAANLLGLGRNTLTRKVQELGIEDKDAK